MVKQIVPTSGTTNPHTGHYQVTPEDVQTFTDHLRNFVPPEAFEVHGHFYDRSHIDPTFECNYLKEAPNPVGWENYQVQLSKWMGGSSGGYKAMLGLEKGLKIL